MGDFLIDQASKTIARPSRLFFVPLRYVVLTLLRFPGLLPLVQAIFPERWNERESLKAFRVSVAEYLFQQDRSAEALHYLDVSQRNARPSIDENLVRGMCLYQGFGRFNDAVALWARANECGLEEAQRLGLSTLRVRVLDSAWARHIGDTAMLDYVIKLGVLEGRGREDTILYLPRGSRIANRFLLRQIATLLHLVEDPADLPFDASALQALHYDLLCPRLPDGTTTYIWEIAAKTYRTWHREQRKPMLTLPTETEVRGWAALQKAGMPRGAWFVALHVREGKWNGRDPGLRGGTLNADPTTYLPAAAEITRRGGWVVRMGDPGMRPMPPLPSVFDYCHSDARADWMDIFIAARCRFMIGTSSGPAYIPPLYGVPCVLTNWWPTAQRPWHASDLFIPKMMRRQDGSYLTLDETLREPFSYCHSRRFLADLGVQVEDNEPEIIRGAVEEMLTRLDGKATPDTGIEALRQRADLIYQSNDAFGGAALARDFLRRYDGFIA
jgi:putative glycosyltransferase (TIGR04372 family)